MHCNVLLRSFPELHMEPNTAKKLRSKDFSFVQAGFPHGMVVCLSVQVISHRLN